MYRRIENGTIQNIQGLECCIPPVGYVWNILSDKLEYTGVYQRSDNPLEQYWERFALPSWYKEVTKKEDDYLKNRKDDALPFYDERYEKYKTQEWFRRLNGIWIMIKGVPTFLPPLYYYVLQWFRIDVGYAKFTKPHLKAFMFLDYCINDPICWGMLGITKRRFLKTYMIGAFIVEYITRTKNANGGLQSKTGNDAKKVFSKAIVYPFRGMPRFFRPEYDTSLGVNPKTEMRFQQTNIRGKKAEDNIDKDELNSGIEWGSADPIHFDGYKLIRFGSDEWGKTTEANVFDRNEVVRFCQLDEEGKIIGKSLWFTTVEKLDSEKDGVQEAAKQLWDASDQMNRKENGQTESGLYRFFQTADESKNFDIYGEPDVEKTIRDILSDRKSVENNPRALSARRRKEPRTIGEAFSTDADACAFNAANIDDREEELKEKPVYKRPTWYYRNLDGTVDWRDPRGKELDFCWHMSSIPSKEESNKFNVIDGLHHPARMDRGAISVDGVSNTQGGEKWGSKLCAWVGTRFDAFNPSSGKVTGMLYGKPADMDIAYDQILLCAEFHGFQVFWEHVADAYYPFFRKRGRVNYLALYPLITIDLTKNETPVRHRGVPTTPFSLSKQNELGLAYFENYCDRIDFTELLIDAKSYDPNNRTKSDKTVSFLIFLTGISEPLPKKERPKTPIVRVYKKSKESDLEIA